jgi:hypothetical protein
MEIFKEELKHLPETRFLPGSTGRIHTEVQKVILFLQEAL